eukprot:TRINITY_DN54822_c0_g1_i1.p1 TRINITY_DN54822_c0_g1~~TRINITY_DN54822_c0_g1_i1.p1  ORF type:complete len:354 (+),score=37.21 TRINITY_DN54822_c0_g1_i1:68-1129(+)
MRKLYLLAGAVVLVPLLWRTYMLKGFTEFTENDIPNLSGKVAIVTGANTGLGFETARALAEHGATVLLGCRTDEKCRDAANRINEKCKALGSDGSAIVPAALDLSDANSVASFANSIKASYEKLDFLVNNAAVMNVPEGRNAQGFEMQLATNHLGHFLLTGYLLGLLKRAKGRVVNHSSSMSADFIYKIFHYMDSEKPWSGVNMSDLNWEHRPYDTYAAYSQTKRANLLFTHELNRRFGHIGVTATACDPGGSKTELQQKATGMSRSAHEQLLSSMSLGTAPSAGALMQTYATVKANPDEMISPLWGMMGPPIVSGTSLKHITSFVPQSFEASDAERLWEQSEKFTGMKYSVP